MAQNARIGALTDELIQTIVGFKPEEDRRAYKHAKDIATRGLKAHQYNRTNQFEVRSSFEGLDEKFRVLNRDDLADALQTRVQELKGIRNKWIPDYLALLLRLSDRPTENSEVEALELLRPPTPPPPLTWAEIIEDDPYSDEEIWKDIDYAAESSDEEQVSSRGKKTKKVSPPSPIDDDDTYSAESCLQPVDTEILPELEKGQFWKAQADEKTGKVEVAELQAIRETLFMLAGHQTALYHTDKAHGSVRVKQTYVFTHAMPKTMDHLLGQFATIGRDLYRLRMWTSRSSSLPLVQTFESAVRRRLGDYDKSLALLQGKYLVPEAPRSVSLLELHVKVRELSSPLLRLSQLVADIEPQLLVNPFAHLETLFEQITLAQMTLEKDLFAFLSDMFFECLQTYLKPIRRWMEAGELGANDETFFVFENDSGSEASSLWHDRFVLRRGKGDTLRSPTFLEPAAMKIFNTGKSVVFLKELGIYDKVSHPVENEPRLDHPAVCGTADLPLSPFPELFHSAFETWIRSKYSLASTVLRSHLFEQCGLLQILDNFHLLYLGADGSLFQGFADAIFERMDSKQRGWNDRFLLTELARGVYGTSLTKSNAEKIVVRSVRTKTETRLVKGLATLSLDYALPWSVTNIIQRSTMPIYQQVFTFLLQVYRAKYLLQNIPLKTIQQLRNTPLRQLSFKLRNQLIWFTDILRSYLTEAVIAQCHAAMLTAMTKAEDIDEMASYHVRYLARVQEQALLAENLRPIYNAVTSVLDLAVLFHDAHIRLPSSSLLPGQASRSTSSSTTHPHGKMPSKRASKPKLKRRKSVIPAIVEDYDSPSERDDMVDESTPAPSSSSKTSNFQADLQTVDTELKRLLPFVIAGLRNIGRVGAQPVWDALAERLEWGRGGGSGVGPA